MSEEHDAWMLGRSVAWSFRMCEDSQYIQRDPFDLQESDTVKKSAEEVVMMMIGEREDELKEYMLRNLSTLRKHVDILKESLEYLVRVLTNESNEAIRKKNTEASIDLGPASSKQSRLHTPIKKAIDASLDAFLYNKETPYELYERLAVKSQAWREFATWYVLHQQRRIIKEKGGPVRSEKRMPKQQY